MSNEDKMVCKIKDAVVALADMVDTVECATDQSIPILRNYVELRMVCDMMIRNHGETEDCITLGHDDWYAFRLALDPSFRRPGVP